MKRLKTKGRHTSGGGGTAGAAQAVGEGAERPAEAGDETKAVGKGNGGLAVGPEQIGVAIPGGTLAAGDKEFNHMAAPKWWSTVDVVTTQDGKLRRITDDEKAEQEIAGAHVLLAKPSVRYRKTVNTYDHAGRPTSVHAQQYAVLVTNVNQPVYPEYQGDRPVLGAGICGNPNVKYGGDDVWLGERHRQFVEALEASKRAVANASRPPRTVTGKDAQAAVQAAEAVAALEAAEAGLPAGVAPWSASRGRGAVAPGRAAELWGRARAAVRSGRVRRLLTSETYSTVGAVFAALFPDDFDRVVPVFNFRETDLLMRQWDIKLGQLEAAERAVALGGKRKTIRPKGSGGAVDQIEWLVAEVARLERAVLEARDRALVFNSTPSSFVLFRTQKAAAIASSCNIHPLRKELFKVFPAPGPEEVNWEALWFTHAQRVRRAFYVTPFLVVLVLLPVSLLTSAMTQLNDLFCSANNTKLRWDDYCYSGMRFFTILRSVLTGFVPALLIQLWQGLLMPRLVYLAAQSEACHYSLSDLDRRMGSIYFLWGCFNFFGGGVIGSTALARVPEIINKPFETPQLLGYALPATAKFFFSYLILRTLMTIPLRFLITQPGVWQAWIRIGLMPFSKSMRDDHVAERTLFMRNAIRSPRYGVEYGANTCLILLICFAFAVICPLLPLFGVFFFLGQWLFWRYQLIYNYQRKYESGGQFFPFVADRIMVCAAVMVAFTGCVMIVKRAWAQATLDLYIHGMREMPLLVAQMAPRARVPATVYVPPPLQANGWLWYPEFNRCWEWFGMPGYSW
ncbi:ERD4-related membrane protein [Monoraphidium neglectum]|uniref:ERD4-related membrane protein n=1 Tax=Monoraphidium neglectum TaxID=145388 RepID=A0A0D2M026_9CHLO|nr:ERD4-related membrane protein [Monoraphidium neglectum]KIY96999.1 ERD4-related membrane protein [Monoraphidium neglectum]|eukprot:XP_013896019.1 ERD4-related membrane protein [Monoraphidium neglectum]